MNLLNDTNEEISKTNVDRSSNLSKIGLKPGMDGFEEISELERCSKIIDVTVQKFKKKSLNFTQREQRGREQQRVQMSEMRKKHAKRENEWKKEEESLRQEIVSLKSKNRSLMSSILDTFDVSLESIALQSDFDISQYQSKLCEMKHSYRAKRGEAYLLKQTNENMNERMTKLKAEFAAKEIEWKQAYRKIDALTIELRKEHSKSESFRAKAIGFKKLAMNLPPARSTKIEWDPPIPVVKEENANSKCNGYVIRRSKRLQTYKQIIEEDRQRNGIKKVIAQNPMVKEGEKGIKYSQSTLKNIERFVHEFGIKSPKLDVRKAPKYDHFPILEGQNECVAKVDINESEIVGCYYGTEMLDVESDAIYNGTMEEKRQLTYRHGENLRLPNGEEIAIVIDPIAFAMRSGKKKELSLSPFCFINDGRVNIKEDATPEDEDRMNTQWVSILHNGWPKIFVEATKRIPAGTALWIPYGPYYKNVLQDMEYIEDQRKKMEDTVNLMNRNVDLQEQRPIDISEGDEDSVQRSGSSRKRRRDEKCEQVDGQNPIYAFESRGRKRQRLNLYGRSDLESLIDRNVTILIGGDRFDGIPITYRVRDDGNVDYKIIFDVQDYCKPTRWVNQSQIQPQDMATSTTVAIGDEVETRSLVYKDIWRDSDDRVDSIYQGAKGIIVKLISSKRETVTLDRRYEEYINHSNM